MKSNTTQFRNFKAGSSKSLSLVSTQKRLSPSLSENYKLVLQFYCVNKQAAIKKELKYEGPVSFIHNQTTPTPSFSLSSWIAPIFNINFSILKKLRQGITLVTE